MTSGRPVDRGALSYFIDGEPVAELSVVETNMRLLGQAETKARPHTHSRAHGEGDQGTRIRDSDT